MIVVVDTNVWISAFVFGRPDRPRGVPLKALFRAAGTDQLATSPEIRGEIFRILTEKYRWSDAAATLQIGRFHDTALTFDLQHNVHVCRDPKDNMFLECAALARADVLVTGDNDLLSLGSFGDIRILTPAEYLALP